MTVRFIVSETESQSGVSPYRMCWMSASELSVGVSTRIMRMPRIVPRCVCVSITHSPLLYV